MMRGISRSLQSSLNTARSATTKAASSPVAQSARFQQGFPARHYRSVALARPLAQKPLALVRWQSTSSRPGLEAVDEKREAKISEKIMAAHPERVSATSTSPSLTAQKGAEEDETKMLAGIYSDLNTIRETFSLKEVPREAYYMGMAGVLPYMATSLSTVYCAWEINHSAETGAGFLMSDRTAELLLHIIEPLQVGYGAVIISFLGAIHWGLEWAGYGGTKGYPRYMIGVVSTAFAWPTLLLSAESALISQFLIFNFLYYTDSRATKRGWAPPWYGVYRFVLTFVVGGSIVVSLIGRGQIAHRIDKPPGHTDRIKALRDSQADELESEEESRRRYLAEKDEEEDDDDDE